MSDKTTTEAPGRPLSPAVEAACPVCSRLLRRDGTLCRECRTDLAPLDFVDRLPERLRERGQRLEREGRRIRRVGLLTGAGSVLVLAAAAALVAAPMWARQQQRRGRAAREQTIRTVQEVLATLHRSADADSARGHLELAADAGGRLRLVGSVRSEETRDLAAGLVEALLATPETGREVTVLGDLSMPPRRTVAVLPGDCLWDIAAREWGDGALWTRLIAANPGLEPQRLQPGRRLLIPPDGSNGR